MIGPRKNKFFKISGLIVFFICLAISLNLDVSASSVPYSNLKTKDKSGPGLMRQPEAADEEVVRFIVKFRPDKTNLKESRGRSRGSALAGKNKIEKRKDNPNRNFSVFEAKGQGAAERAMNELRRQDDVEYVEIDYRYSQFAISSDDTYREYLWGLDNTGQTVNRGEAGTADADMDAPEAWQISTGSAAAIVAVIDSGVAYEHPDLVNSMWDGSDCLDHNGDYLGGCEHGYDYAGNDKFPLPYDSSHGTHVAGTIAASLNNGAGIIGAAPNARIMALATDLYTSEIVECIAFAEHNGAHIINASWGGSVFSQTLYDAIASTSALFVAAAGNNGTNNDNSPKYPCAYDLDNIFCVAATDRDDDLAYFSNYGTTTVDVGAPGDDIYSTLSSDLFYSEDFEGVAVPALPAGYIASGTWATATTSDPDWGNVLYGDGSRSPYTDNNESLLTSPTIDLSGLSTSTYAYFDYWISCDTEYGLWADDAFVIYFSPDGSDFDYIDYWNESWLDSDTASSGASIYHFQEYTEIGDWYKTADFRFRLAWETNGEDNDYDGCFLDKIEIRAIGDGSDGVYDFFSGTSMAAPNAAGAAALVKGYNPRVTTAQLKAILMESGDTIASLSGKVVSEARINMDSALSLFAPHAGYSADDIIPATQISQLTDGSGRVSVGFRLKDGVENLPATLGDFHYSLDNGIEWNAPTSTDASSALSGNWNDNAYLYAEDYASTSYGFYFNTQDGDVSGLNAFDQSDIRIRFKAGDGAATSSWCVSEAFRVDNLAPDPPVIASPASDATLASSSFFIEGSAATGSLINILRGSSTAASVQMATATAAFSAYVPLEEGENVFSVLAVDGFGNQSVATTTVTLTRDTLGPSLSLYSIDSDFASPYYIASSAAIATISGESGMLCRWSLSNSETYSTMANDCGVTAATATCAIAATGADGLKSFYIGCRDSLGNENEGAGLLDAGFYQDTAAPAVYSVSISPHPTPPGTTTVSIVLYDLSGVATATVPTIEITGLSASSYTLTQSDFSTTLSTTTWTGYFVLADDNEEASGSIDVISFSDILGQAIIATTVAGTINVDSINPDACTLSGLPLSGTYNTSAAISVGGTDIAYYSYKLDSGAYSAEISTATVISLSGLAVGAHTIYVLGRDQAGNWQTDATSYSWQINAAPGGGGGGGGGGGSVSQPVATSSPIEVGKETKDERTSEYLSPDGTRVVYVYETWFIGGIIDRLSVRATISPAGEPKDTLAVILPTDKLSLAGSIRLDMPSGLRAAWYARNSRDPVVVNLKAARATTSQRTEFARQGKYMLGFDVYSVAIGQGGADMDKFTPPLNLSFDLSRIEVRENLQVHYFDKNSGQWKPVTGPQKIKDGQLSLSLDHLTDFCLMREAEDRYIPLSVTPKPVTAPGSQDRQWSQIERDAAEVYRSGSSLDGFLAYNGKKTDLKAQVEVMGKYTSALVKGFPGLETSSVYAINNFIVYGSPSTYILGAGERAGAVNSYIAAFRKAPRSQAEWVDCIAISNGRWTRERSEAAEAGAKEEFRTVYLRAPDMNNPKDNAGVMVIAYGLRPSDRKLVSEKASIAIFKAIYKYHPVSALDWDIVRAIAYSGAVRK